MFDRNSVGTDRMPLARISVATMIGVIKRGAERLSASGVNQVLRVEVFCSQ